MKTKYWLDKVRQAYSLGVVDGRASCTDGLDIILGEINHDLVEEFDHDLGEGFEHKYATNEILEEIAQKIAIELTRIEEAKNETDQI